MPPDLLLEAARRLRLITLVFASIFFLANFVPWIASGQFPAMFQEPSRWLPGTVSIAISLLVFGLCSSSRIPPGALMTIGLVYEVVGCYGIATAEYWGVYAGIQYEEGQTSGLGLSWVAVWMLFFTVVVPNVPRHTLVAAIGSATSVPVVVALSMAYGGTTIRVPPVQFFFTLVFPYILCVLLAYVGARVIYKLGTDVTRARELGSYRLIERLGAGGMGEVWKASHRMLARPAAIKFIRPAALVDSAEEDPARALKRFELEAQSTASLSSPHTVELYDFGATDDGMFYYVMELLHGIDLERLVKRFGAVQPSRAIALLLQVCDSLEEAHAKGLIHRDIKPANLYICRVGNRHDFVKVLDFGLVAKDSAKTGAETRLTMADVALGTPTYLAPEMASGGAIDARTDLYSLGCVAHWLLTGRLVFEGKTVLEIVAQHMHGLPEPPSKSSPHCVPRELDAVILACLAKSPSERPANARELARRLGSVPLETEWTEERAEDWWRSNLPGSD